MDRSRVGRVSQLVLHFFSPSALLVLGFLAVAPSAYGQIKPVELEGFVVTGTPLPRTQGTEASHVTILIGEDLRLRGITRVAEALAEVPGLVLVQNGSYGSVASVFFRGAESDHVKVLLDGVEVNQAGGSFDLSGLIVSDVERIEVVRGPASAFYGSDAMAGVIHIITRRGEGPLRATLSGTGGSYGRAEWSAGLVGGTATTGYSLSMTRTSSDGILEFNNHFENQAYSGTLHLSPDEKTRVRISGRYGDRTYHFPTDGSGNVVDRNAYSFGEEVSLTAEAGRQISHGLELLAVVNGYDWDGGTNDGIDGPADTLGFYSYNSQDSFRRVSADLRLNLGLGANSGLSAGMELEEEKQRSFSESFSDFGPSTVRNRYRRSNRGYYAHLVTEGAGWAGNVGVRLEDNEQYGGFFTYQAGLSYSLPTWGTRFRGSLGKGLKEPTFLETAATGFSVGNPDLKPERSQGWELGLEQRVGSGGPVFTLTWFHQSLEDLIQYTWQTPQPGDPNYFNVAEARTQGLEATVAASWSSIQITGGYTYLDSEVLDAGFDEGDGAVFVEGVSLIRRPNHQASFTAVYRLAGAALTGSLRRVGPRSDRDFSAWPSSPVELAGYTLLGLGGEMDLLAPLGRRPGVTVRLNAENLLDQDYQEVFGFSAPGRTFLVGVRMRFGSGG